jgi:hypothetical protein
MKYYAQVLQGTSKGSLEDTIKTEYLTEEDAKSCR